jgi:acyl-CoA synthetase (AMP-forming)/AMP-acid ligase II
MGAMVPENDGGIAAAFERAARADGSVTAVVCDGALISYGELLDAVRSFAGWLVKQKPGGEVGRVGLLMRNRIEYIVAMLGAAFAGVTAVPINRRASATELAQICDRASLGLIVSEGAFTDHVRALGAIRPDLTIVDSAGLGSGTFVPWSTVMAGGPLARRQSDPEAPQSIHFTSGTTGTPKGVVRSRASNDAQAFAAVTRFDLGPGDTWMFTVPFHSAGFYGLALPPLLVGATLIVSADFDPGEVGSVVEQHRVSHIHMVPTMWEMMARAEESTPHDLTSITVALWGGSPLRRGTATKLERLLPVPCLGCYGSTEATCITYSTPEVYRSGRYGSSGFPIGGTELRVIDETGTALQPGTVGELQVRGTALMIGYLDMPEETQRVLDKDGWFSTGDLGILDSDGALTVADRVKDMLISGGENVYPAEVENVISAVAGVGEVAVIGVADDLWGQVVTAVVAASPSTDLRDRILEACARSLAPYKKPREVVIVDELPKNALGKIDKVSLASTDWLAAHRSA